MHETSKGSSEGGNDLLKVEGNILNSRVVPVNILV